jgi:hypothetical protein
VSICFVFVSFGTEAPNLSHNLHNGNWYAIEEIDESFSGARTLKLSTVI